MKTGLVLEPEPARVPESLTTWDILDLAKFRVYVVDVLTHALIYTNHKQHLPQAGGNVKCYQTIYRQDRACLSCKITELTDAAGRPNGQHVTHERFNEADDCWCQLQEGTLTLADGRTVMYSIANDISAIKEMQNHLAEAHAELAFRNQQLESLSTTDQLTGLFNRRKLDQVLAQECERAMRTQSPLTVIILDIDHFKNVNDLHGHPIGDQVIAAIAELLRQGVRQVDTVARWGGEEFVILCPATDLAGACALAESMRSTIEKNVFALVGSKTCSFGVALYRPGEPVQAVIGRADQALYRGKHSGRNQVCTE